MRTGDRRPTGPEFLSKHFGQTTRTELVIVEAEPAGRYAGNILHRDALLALLDLHGSIVAADAAAYDALCSRDAAEGSLHLLRR